MLVYCESKLASVVLHNNQNNRPLHLFASRADYEPSSLLCCSGLSKDTREMARRMYACETYDIDKCFEQVGRNVRVLVGYAE